MSKKIMVIDDDRTQVKMIESLLTANGMEVLACFDGEEGLQKLSTMNPPPDLIILDVQMPKMNGYTFIFELKQLGENFRSIPIIVLTAKEGMADIFKVEGVKEYLVKPFRVEDILEKVRKYL